MKWLFRRAPIDGEPVPTHTIHFTKNIGFTVKWAIARLQTKASYSTAGMRKAGLDSRDDNLRNYHCTRRSHRGDLYLNSSGVKVISAIRKTLFWEVRFDQLRSIQKVSSGERLLFVSAQNENSSFGSEKKERSNFSIYGAVC